jgi:toxin YhaV
MPGSPDTPPNQPGWRRWGWSGFAKQLEQLERAVDRLSTIDPDGYERHPQAKLLGVVNRLIRDVIPRNPDAPEFRLGNTLGPEHRHWRRAKFSGRYRLFFRFDSASRTIVYGWMNDENTLRKAGGRTDPYAVFHQMLERGQPPSDWDDLVRESSKLAE